MFHPLPVTFITKLVREDPRTYTIMMPDVDDTADKRLGLPWRFLITGSDKLVIQLSLYTSCTLCCLLTAIYIDME
jgi:hypothetical protein